MAETIKIGGELESTATGNKVADVANIKDKTKGDKSQAEINAETDAAIQAEIERAIDAENNRYTKSETYNKSELNNMITTPNQQYVSVTATAQTTSATDVLPATGAADTVYRVGNWNGSQFDANEYSEYAWNGSQYVHLSTKTKIGEVFDISAYHATGGTLATYADLSAALDSNNGGGVPQSLQEGGMSVKFVRTYDNKYVKFFCTADEFTTDVDKWQGVDDEPTAGSDNLVKSGGVAKISQNTLVTNLENKAVGITYTTGKNINLHGVVIDVSDHYVMSSPVQISKGDVLAIKVIRATLISQNTAIFETDSQGSSYTPLVIKELTEDRTQISFVAGKDMYVAFNSRTDYDVNVSIINSDAYTNLINHSDKKVSNRYFLEPKKVGNIVIELYLKGLDASKKYYISEVGIRNGSNYWMVIVDNNGNQVARTNIPIADYTFGVVPVDEKNSSGVSGYAILNISANDIVYTDSDASYKNLNSGEINIDVVSNIDYSPVIKNYIYSVKNPYFKEAKDVVNRVTELYLTGLDNTKDYYISLIGINRIGGELRMYIADAASNTTVARVMQPANTKDICEIVEHHSSGISGYALLNVSDDDLVAKGFVSGYIDKDVVSSIYNSPSINQHLNVPQEVGDFLGTDAKNMYSQITWNTGYYYIYHYGQTDQDSSGCRINTDSTYKYSSPFLMKKGDIIEYDLRNVTSGGFSDRPATALVVRSTQDGVRRESLLNQVRQNVARVDRNYYRFVADRDMYVSCNIIAAYNSEEYFKWYRADITNDTKDNLLERNPFHVSNEAETILEQCAMPNTGETGAEGKQLCLVHLSDIHNDYFRYENVCLFKEKYAKYIDDIILTGDLTGSSYYNFDRSILDIGGYDKILKVIGNHDVYDHHGDAVEQGASSYAAYEYWATSAEKYKLWMQGAIEGSERNDIALWNVIQPENAATLGLCYYYKDYTEQKVRLIVLDAMDVDEHNVISTAQLNWFEGVLTETITEGNAAYGYHVIIADHFATRTTFADTHYLNCGFTNIIDPTFGGIGQRLVPFCNKVDTFINNGGVFICWICGHFHWDVVATTVAHPKQLFIAVAAAAAGHNYTYRERVPGHKSEDCFNVVAVDTYTKHVRVARIGCEFNKFLQHAGTMCISYDTTGDKVPQLISSW